MEMKDIQLKLEELKMQLETALTEKQKAEITEQLITVNNSIAELKGGKTDIEELKAKLVVVEKALSDNQPVIDSFVKGHRRVEEKPKSFTSAFCEAIKKQHTEILRLKNEKGRIKIDMDCARIEEKSVANMTLGAHLTGDQQATYMGVGILAGHINNLRDFIPTTPTSTGLAVSFRETGGEGAIARQTEGSAKAQVDYDLTEVKVVQRYIAGWVKVSRQMLQDLPFLETSLSRMLIRDYYKKENALLYADLSSATYSTAHTPGGSSVAEKVLNMVIKQRSNGYNASAVFIDYTDYATILTSARPSTGTDYGLPFGFAVSSLGQITCLGSPVVPASWVTTSDIQVIDNSLIERVEVDGLSITMSTEDSDNFEKNLVTVKVECRCDLNAVVKAAHLNYGTAS